MGDGPDLRVDEESVRRITEGLRGAVGELREVGTGTGSVLGKGFSELAMTGMEAGHHGLSVDFEDFCERWEWGVRALVQDANTIAAELGLAAGLLWEEEQYIQATMRIGANALVGNPYASEEEVAAQSWSETLTPDALDPDYSGESFGQLARDAEQTWRDTGQALLTEGTGGRNADILDGLLGADTSGPSPEQALTLIHPSRRRRTG
ncbi:hypothetical protein [Streptomyces specialis]|uniref:hypothetical protein n=1 Tax=Streptomyces specialis TaxID=498367 RepID=UPI000A7A6C8C|nr:hypothetical protein [Streptomyces specialis]